MQAQRNAELSRQEWSSSSLVPNYDVASAPPSTLPATLLSREEVLSHLTLRFEGFTVHEDGHLKFPNGPIWACSTKILSTESGRDGHVRSVLVRLVTGGNSALNLGLVPSECSSEDYLSEASQTPGINSTGTSGGALPRMSIHGKNVEVYVDIAQMQFRVRIFNRAWSAYTEEKVQPISNYEGDGPFRLAFGGWNGTTYRFYAWAENDEADRIALRTTTVPQDMVGQQRVEVVEGGQPLRRGEGFVGMQVVYIGDEGQYGFHRGDVCTLVSDDGSSGDTAYKFKVNGGTNGAKFLTCGEVRPFGASGTLLMNSKAAGGEWQSEEKTLYFSAVVASVQGRQRTRGDRVMIKIMSVEEAEALAEDHGGWNSDMAECLGLVGRILDVDMSDDTISVETSNGQTYCWNKVMVVDAPAEGAPAAAPTDEPASAPSEGDRVSFRVVLDAKGFHVLNGKHPGKLHTFEHREAAPMEMFARLETEGPGSSTCFEHATDRVGSGRTPPPHMATIKSLREMKQITDVTIGCHKGSACDRSGQTPIVGYRYAKRNQNYDLCQAEFDKLSEAEKDHYEKKDAPDIELLNPHPAQHLTIFPKADGGKFGIDLRETSGEMVELFGQITLISSVEEASPAYTAGLNPGDLVTMADGLLVTKSELHKVLSDCIASRRPCTLGFARPTRRVAIQLDEDDLQGGLSISEMDFGLELYRGDGGDGLVVSNVALDSKAMHAELCVGDIIVAVNGRLVDERYYEEYGLARPRLGSAEVGESLRLVVAPLCMTGAPVRIASAAEAEIDDDDSRL